MVFGVMMLLLLGVIFISFIKEEQPYIKQGCTEMAVSQQLRQVDKLKDHPCQHLHELRTPLNGIVGLSESLGKINA
jgi:signal transduction histidine kinase